MDSVPTFGYPKSITPCSNKIIDTIIWFFGDHKALDLYSLVALEWLIYTE